MITNTMRYLAMRVAWPISAAVALSLLWLTYTSQTRQGQHPLARAEVSQAVRNVGDAVPAPEEPTVSSPEAQLTRYDSIVKVRGSDDGQLLLLTFPFPDSSEGIRCVDAISGKLKWQQIPASEGRYTHVEAGEHTLVECTGWPQKNHLAVRRLADGRILGRPWKLGQLLDVAISGRRVAAAEWIVVQHGREIAVTNLGEQIEGEGAIRVRVFDEWGRPLASRRFRGFNRLVGFSQGFAVVSGGQTTILTRDGRRAVTLR